MSTSEGRGAAGNASMTTNENKDKPWPPAGIDWYYSDGSTAIALGDCRLILPHLEPVDLVLTDPPYGIARVMKGGKGTGHWTLLSDGNSWDNEAPDLTFLMNSGQHFVIWGGNYFNLPLSRCWFVWDKLNAVPTMGQ